MRDPIGVVDSVEERDCAGFKARLLKDVEGLEGVVGVIEEPELAMEALDGKEDVVDAIEGLWEMVGEEPECSEDSGGIGATSRETIFMPLLVLVLAGMKSVVRLFGAAMAIRCGWFALQHPVVSCVPVEYSCRASDRLSCSSTISSRVKECKRV